MKRKHKEVLGEDKNLASDFRSLIDTVFPDLYPYVVRRLNLARTTGAIENSTLDANVILDKVFARLYKQFKDKPGNLPQMKTWIYKMMERALEEVLDEKTLERKKLIRLDKLERLELEEMEEAFTIDAEGELIMIEELDDISYSRYKAYDPFEIIKDETTLEDVNRSLANYDGQLLQQVIRKQLVQLPELERSIFDLFWLEGMELEQIAEIRGISISKVEGILKKVTPLIKGKLEKKLNRGK